MCQAEHANTPSPQDDLDQSLCDARVIADIIGHLADHATSGTDNVCSSSYAWLAGQLNVRLERVEVANMAMRGV